MACMHPLEKIGPFVLSNFHVVIWSTKLLKNLKPIVQDKVVDNPSMFVGKGCVTLYNMSMENTFLH